VNADEAALARQALLAAAGCARRLERSRRELAGRFPMSAATITALTPEAEDDLDAFLKRFEQLVTTLQNEIFKAIAALGGEDIRELSRREIAELMERLGAIQSAATFRTLVAVRNRVAHVYPDDPERQARNVNEAYAAIRDAMSAWETSRGYLEKRLPGPPGD
jgi:uncharacterized protein YutE (UPF0331/DUF86 family)